MSNQDAAVIVGDQRHSHADIMERTARAATGLQSLGIGAGDSVALMLRNDVPYLEASGAAARLGAYSVPVNWHFTADETRYILENSEAKALVIHADVLADIRTAIPEGVHVFAVPTPDAIANAYGVSPADAALADGDTSWHDWLAGFDAMPDEDLPNPGSMIYTSGTTGNPKGVRRATATLEQFQRFVGSAAMAFGLMQLPLRSVMTGPLYHAAPNTYGSLIVRFEGLLILQPRFDAEELLQLIETHKITHLHMVPTMFVRLLKLPEDVKSRYDLSSLKYVIHGAAPCPPEVKRAMIEWWGPVIWEYYGATELGLPTVISSEDWLKRPTSVGKAQPGVFIKIVDADHNELPPTTDDGPDNIGEVFILNSAATEFTYFKDAAKRAEAGLDDYVSCGDNGWLDEDGYLHLSGRSSDMVISGGVNIYPAEIEAAIHDVPGVLDCGVFGIPHPEYSEQLVAVVQTEDGSELTADDIRAGLQGRIAGYKIPRIIDFTDDMPREDSGKIFKRKLRDAYL